MSSYSNQNFPIVQPVTWINGLRLYRKYEVKFNREVMLQCNKMPVTEIILTFYRDPYDRLCYKKPNKSYGYVVCSIDGTLNNPIVYKENGQFILADFWSMVKSVVEYEPK